MDDRTVYLDYAAATPLDPLVAEAMEPYLSECFYNPSAPYALGRQAKAAYEQARTTLARLMGAKPGNVTITAGATEANNLAFASARGHVVVAAVEHDSVLACAHAREHTVVGVDGEGFVDPGALAGALTPDTELVSVSLANGEIGTVQNLRALARVLEEERARRDRCGQRRPLRLHTDASQAAGLLSVNVSSLGAELVTVSAAKLYGPKQVGLLWAADGVALRPLVLGGGQEGGVRSGTENVAGAVGFAKALELAAARRKQEARRLEHLRDGLQTRLSQAFPRALISGPRNNAKRLPNLLHISFPGLQASRLVIALERSGVSVGTGSACAASKMRVSHVLEAIGLPREAAAGSLRITLGKPTTGEDVAYAAAAVERAVRSEVDRTGAAL